MLCRMCECYSGGIVVMDVFWLRFLCTYDLRTGDLIVLSWAWVRRVRRGSNFAELRMCGGGVCRILLLPLVDRCLETKKYVYCACLFL